MDKVVDKNKSIYFKSLNDLFSFMSVNHVFEFDILPERELVDIAIGEGSSIVVLDYGGENNVVVGSDLFDKHYFEFVTYYRDLVIEQIEAGVKLIKIPDFAIDSDLIEILKQNCSKLIDVKIEIVNFENFKYFDWFVNDLMSLDLNIFKDNVPINVGYIFGYPEELWKREDGSTFSISTNIDDDEFKHFLNVGENAIIYLEPVVGELDEKKYIERLLNIFEILRTHSRRYNIEIDINNRELLMRSELLNFSNINLTIKTEGEKYSKKEFLDEDAILEELVRPIKEANLSPFERYLAAYNVVKTYRAYQKDPADSKISRSLKYILDKNNKYIVCVGYAQLLKALLNKLDISCYTISFDVDVSKEHDFKNGDEPLEGHMRNIVKIDDDKYNIHGIYEGDTTWDNRKFGDYYYNYAIMTFDRVKELRSLETLIDEDLLLDFHNLDDFNDKIKFFLVKSVRVLRNNHRRLKSNGTFDTFNEEKAIVKAFIELYNNILGILSCLDYKMYLELYNKYNHIISGIFSKYENCVLSFDDVVDIFKSFLDNYYGYVISISNKEISKETLYMAISHVKRTIDCYDEEELEEYIEGIAIVNERNDEVAFPYVFNTRDSGSTFIDGLDGSRPNYLGERRNMGK